VPRSVDLDLDVNLNATFDVADGRDSPADGDLGR
jgi:hypothetical protein